MHEQSKYLCMEKATVKFDLWKWAGFTDKSDSRMIRQTNISFYCLDMVENENLNSYRWHTFMTFNASSSDVVGFSLQTLLQYQKCVTIWSVQALIFPIPFAFPIWKKVARATELRKRYDTRIKDCTEPTQLIKICQNKLG